MTEPAKIVHVIKAMVGEVVEIQWHRDPALLQAPLCERHTAPPTLVYNERLHAQVCGCDAGAKPPWVCEQHRQAASEPPVTRDA